MTISGVDIVAQVSALHGLDLEAASHRALVATEVQRGRARVEAADLLRREQRGQGGPLPTPQLLRDFLAIPDEPVRERITDVMTVGSRIVLAAQFKAGKTTLRDHLVRSLVDGDPFLGRYIVEPFEGVVTVADNELYEPMFRAWMREQQIVNDDRVAVLSLKGRVAFFDIIDPDVRSEWAVILRALNASILIFDCLRPVLDALGLDENRDAGRFLVAFDALLLEAGVKEAVLVHHMGHNGERSRGDTRLRDWPDAEWRLVREDDEPNSARYFSAFGRDVDVAEGLLAYDPGTRRLTYAGGNRGQTAADAGVPEVLEYLRENPGASGRAVAAALKDGLGEKATRAALKRAISRGLVVVTEGPRRAQLHFLREPNPETQKEI